MKKLLVKNIGLLATPEGKSAHRGSEQGKIKFLKDAWVLIEDGVIASVGTGEAPAAEGAEIVDAEGKLVTPGLVDAHTHLIFGGWRQNELGMKLHGKTYLEIQNAGGGIQSTTNATRGATEEELTAKAHNSELKPADSTVVCVDYMQSGVGSNSCGPKLHEKYRLDDAEFDFDLVLRPQAL